MLQLVSRKLRSIKSNDAAQFGPLVGHGDPVDAAQLLSKGSGNQPDSFADGFEAPAEGIVDCNAKGELTGVTAFPELEAFCVHPQLIMIDGEQFRSVMVELGRFDLLKQSFTYVKHAGAARTT